MGKVKEFESFTDRELFNINGTLSPERIEKLIEREELLQQVEKYFEADFRNYSTNAVLSEIKDTLGL